MKTSNPLNQPFIDYICSVDYWSKEKKILVKKIALKVLDKYYLKEPRTLQDAILSFLGTIETAIDMTKKAK